MPNFLDALESDMLEHIRRVNDTLSSLRFELEQDGFDLDEEIPTLKIVMENPPYAEAS